MKNIILCLLVALFIYGFFAVVAPCFVVIRNENRFTEGQLTRVTSLGRFVHGQFGVLDYDIRNTGEKGDSEFVLETYFLCKSLAVKTERQENGIYTTKWVWAGNRRYGNRRYGEALLDHPKILAEAEKVLQLGRDAFAKAKKKLEEQKSKPNQSDRLG